MGHTFLTKLQYHFDMSVRRYNHVCSSSSVPPRVSTCVFTGAELPFARICRSSSNNQSIAAQLILSKATVFQDSNYSIEDNQPSHTQSITGQAIQLMAGQANVTQPNSTRDTIEPDTPTQATLDIPHNDPGLEYQPSLEPPGYVSSFLPIS